jgi:hypothetical protein
MKSPIFGKQAKQMVQGMILWRLSWAGSRCWIRKYLRGLILLILSIIISSYNTNTRSVNRSCTWLRGYSWSTSTFKINIWRNNQEVWLRNLWWIRQCLTLWTIRLLSMMLISIRSLSTFFSIRTARSSSNWESSTRITSHCISDRWER